MRRALALAALFSQPLPCAARSALALLEAEAAKLSQGRSAPPVPPVSAAAGPAQATADPQRSELERAAIAIAVHHLGLNPALAGQTSLERVPEVASVSAVRFPNGEIGGSVTFVQQTFRSIPVEGTGLIVFIRPEGESARNPWRMAADLERGLNAAEPATPEETARRSLLGLALTYRDIAGRPRQTTLSEEDLGTPGSLAIVGGPDDAAGRPTFRLAWRVRAGRRLAWHVFVDAADGRVLKTDQLFAS